MKKIISLFLAFFMIFCLCANVCAEVVAFDANVEGGKITKDASVLINKDADEKFGDVYRTIHNVLPTMKMVS